MAGRAVIRWARRLGIVGCVTAFVAAGSGGVARADGFWDLTFPPTPGHESVLNSVSCVSETVCTAVGRYVVNGLARTLIVRTVDGGVAWRRQTSPNPGGMPSELEAVSCTTITDCTAVGFNWYAVDEFAYGKDPLVVRTTDGANWASVGGVIDSDWRNAVFSGVSCAAPTRCHAVGDIDRNTPSRFPLIMRTTSGNFWRELPAPTSTGRDHLLRAIDCTTARHCTAVGRHIVGVDGRALVLRTTDGRNFTRMAAPNPPGSDLQDVSCSSVVTCTAVGTSLAVQRAFVIRGDGSTWTRASTPTLRLKWFSNGVSCRSVNQCTVVGYRGNTKSTLLRTSDGVTWASPSPLSEIEHQELQSVSCPSPRTCIAVGKSFSQSGSGRQAVAMREME